MWPTSKIAEPTEFAGMTVDCDPSIEPEEAFGYDVAGNQVDPTIETEILRMCETFRVANRIDATGHRSRSRAGHSQRDNVANMLYSRHTGGAAWLKTYGAT